MKTIVAFLLASASLCAQSPPEFETGIEIGDIQSTPEDGSIRWSGEDFEGYDGQSWKSFTRTPTLGGETIADVDGNIYRIIPIGMQTWMRENLRTTRYADGSRIAEITFSSDWSTDTKGGWCWYWNDEQYDQGQGKLYNYYAVDHPSGLCPGGWKVPSADDWQELATFLGASTSADQLKQVGTSNWTTTDDDVNNDSGFTGVPTGYRTFNGSFQPLGIFGNLSVFWSSSQVSDTQATTRTLFGGDSALDIDTESKRTGLVVRCIKG